MSTPSIQIVFDYFDVRLIETGRTKFRNGNKMSRSADEWLLRYVAMCFVSDASAREALSIGTRIAQSLAAHVTDMKARCRIKQNCENENRWPSSALLSRLDLLPAMSATYISSAYSNAAIF